MTRTQKELVSEMRVSTAPISQSLLNPGPRCDCVGIPLTEKEDQLEPVP
jgi:hypothetical protein